MSLQEVLDKISENGKVRVERTDESVDVSIKEGGSSVYARILRIYPHSKSAEFLDIGDEWDELQGALKDEYGGFPELLFLTDYLNEEKYDIIF